MNLISLDEYSKINEAVIGLQNMISVEEFKQLKEDERKNIIKLLLLNSGDGTGLFENQEAVNHILVDRGLLEESDNIFESINESLNEDWDDDVSGAMIATGAAGVAGVASMAAYISFLFKKKKIKKAWDQVATLQKDKSDIDVKEYETKEELKDQKEKDLESLKPDLTPEELKAELRKIDDKRVGLEDEVKTERQKLKDFDKNQEAELENAKEASKQAKIKLYTLDSVKYKDPETDTDDEEKKEEPAPGDKAEGDKAEGDKAEGDKAEGDKAEGDKAEGDKAEGDKKEEEETGKTGTNDSTNQPKGKSLNEKDDEKDDSGELQQAQKALKDIKSDADAKDQKEKDKLKKQRDKAKDDIKNVKKKIVTAMAAAKKAKEEVAKFQDGKEGKEAIRQSISDLKDQIEKDIPRLKDEAREKAKPDPAFADKKSEVKDRYKEDYDKTEKEISASREDAQKEIETATQNADNMSGTAEGGSKSTTLTNKALGFSKKYAQEVKAKNDADVAEHVKKNRAVMGQDTTDLDTKQKDAEERAKNAEKELASKVDTVDGSDEDIKKAEDGVEDKVKQEEDKLNAKKKEGLEAKIENVETKIDSLQQKLDDEGSDMDPKRKEQLKDGIERANKLKDGFKEKLKQIGESFGLKLDIAMLESEVDSMLESYGLILEATRKELIPEEEENKEKAKDDVEKDKKKIDNLKGSKDKEKGSEDEDGDGIKDPEDVAKEIKDKSEKEDESNPLIGKKVVLKNMRDKDLGQLEKATGKIIKSFGEGEREPEGDLPRRAGEPEVYKIKFDKPKDPMYPEINLTKDNFEEAPEKEEKAEESVANKFRNALNEASRLPQLEELKRLQQKVYDSKESGAIDLWEDYAKRVIGVDGEWNKAPEGSWPKAIKELENICKKYSIK